jgi:hypothetical protein
MDMKKIVVVLLVSLGTAVIGTDQGNTPEKRDSLRDNRPVENQNYVDQNTHTAETSEGAVIAQEHNFSPFGCCTCGYCQRYLATY